MPAIVWWDMAPSPFIEMKLSTDHQQILRVMAIEAIKHGLDHDRSRIQIDPIDFPESLTKIAASFVTLQLHDELKGCIGHLKASQPLILDVASNAHSAAFEDRRFTPVTEEDLPDLDIEISILSPPTPIQVDSETELVRLLKPGVDGLILKEKSRQATFLPSVWDMMHSSTEFVEQLKRKAGLPKGYWSDNLQFERYTTYSV